MSAEDPGAREPLDPGRNGTGRIQSLDRAVALLNAIAETSGGSSAPALAQECGINRATAWRLLTTLEHHGLIERDPHTHRFTIGFAISRMASSASVNGLIQRAHAPLERLSQHTGETANIAVPQRLGLTYVHEVIPPVVLSARWLGQQVPLHATSAGKTFLAWLAESEAETMLTAPLTGYTTSTRTDQLSLRDELTVIRQRGYGVAIGELESGVNGVAAPILDVREHPLGIVSVWGPSERMSPQRCAELGASARSTGDAIAHALR